MAEDEEPEISAQVISEPWRPTNVHGRVRILSILAVLGLMGGVSFFMAQVANNPSTPPRNNAPSSFPVPKAVIDPRTAYGVAELQKKLPIKVDQGTTLTSVVYADSVLTFTYTLDATVDKIDVDQYLQLKANVRDKTCKQEEAMSFFNGGGTQRFSWYDRNGKPIGKLELDKNSCG